LSNYVSWLAEPMAIQRTINYIKRLQLAQKQPADSPANPPALNNVVIRITASWNQKVGSRQRKNVLVIASNVASLQSRAPNPRKSSVTEISRRLLAVWHGSATAPTRLPEN
jgi:hypothetical protein